MSKGFRIECEGMIFNADELHHSVQKWDDEKPKAEIFKAVNGDLDIISEGSQPEFEILFFDLSESQYKQLLLLHSKNAIFTTETEGDLSRIIHKYNEMFTTVKTINVSGMTLLHGLIVNLKSQKAGTIINNELIENVCFSLNGDYQQEDITDEGKVIIYRG